MTAQEKMAAELKKRMEENEAAKAGNKSKNKTKQQPKTNGKSKQQLPQQQQRRQQQQQPTNTWAEPALNGGEPDLNGGHVPPAPTLRLQRQNSAPLRSSGRFENHFIDTRGSAVLTNADRQKSDPAFRSFFDTLSLQQQEIARLQQHLSPRDALQRQGDYQLNASSGSMNSVFLAPISLETSYDSFSQTFHDDLLLRHQRIQRQNLDASLSPRQTHQRGLQETAHDNLAGC